VDFWPVDLALGDFDDRASGRLCSVGSLVGGDESAGSGVGVTVGSDEGLVTTNVGELRLWLPAASTARICTTCWPLSLLNQRSLARVSAVVATSKPLSQMR
jgi:hypothetical protein